MRPLKASYHLPERRSGAAIKGMALWPAHMLIVLLSLQFTVYSVKFLLLWFGQTPTSYCYCSLCLYLLKCQQSNLAANAYCANLVQFAVLPPRHRHFSVFIATVSLLLVCILSSCMHAVIDILDYVNGIGNGCIFAQSTPPLLVGTETSLLTTRVSFQRRSPTWNWRYGSRLTSMQADSGDKNDHQLVG